MATAPRPWHEADPPSSENTFYGLSFKDFKALSHREQMALTAKWDRKRGVKPIEHTDPVYGLKWTSLKPTRRPKK